MLGQGQSETLKHETQTAKLSSFGKISFCCGQDEILETFASQSAASIQLQLTKLEVCTQLALPPWHGRWLYETEGMRQLLTRIFRESAHKCSDSGFMQLEHAHQVWQALFLVESSCPETVKDTPPWFREYLQSKWKQEKARPKTSSARHKAISETLSQTGVIHYNEHEEGIDVAIVLEPNALWTHKTVPSPSFWLPQIHPVCSSPEMMKNDTQPGPFVFQSNLTVPTASPDPCCRLFSPRWKAIPTTITGDFDVPTPETTGMGSHPLFGEHGTTAIFQRVFKTHSTLKFSEADASVYKPPVADRQSQFD